MKCTVEGPLCKQCTMRCSVSYERQDDDEEHHDATEWRFFSMRLVMFIYQNSSFIARITWPVTKERFSLFENSHPSVWLGYLSSIVNTVQFTIRAQIARADMTLHTKPWASNVSYWFLNLPTETLNSLYCELWSSEWFQTQWFYFSWSTKLKSLIFAFRPSVFYTHSMTRKRNPCSVPPWATFGLYGTKKTNNLL